MKPEIEPYDVSEGTLAYDVSDVTLHLSIPGSSEILGITTSHINKRYIYDIHRPA